MRSIASRVLALPLVALLVGLALSPALAGYVILEEQGSRTLVSNGRVKVIGSPGHADFVLDLVRGRLWTASPGSRRYWEGPVEQFCAAIRPTIGISTADERQARLAEQVKALEKEVEKLPPDQRAQARESVERLARSDDSGRPRRQVTIEPTNETQTIAGLPARRYQVLADGKPYEDVWLTADPELLKEIGAQAATSTLGRMTACRAAMGRTADSSVESSPEYTRLFRLGWPLKIVGYEDFRGRPSRGESRMLVTSVQREDVADSVFTPPEDYARASLEEVLGGRPLR